jgi:acyl-coenzyme A thioesterase PaaI-like protein
MGPLASAPVRPLPARAVGTSLDPFDDGRPLQDRLAVHCYGCGTLHDGGLRIKSRWEGEAFVCVWQPGPQHIGFPGFVYGGTIASVIDCHAVWAALSLRCRDAGHDLGAGAPPFALVTGSLRVDYLAPARITRALELRAWVVEQDARKSTVVCSVHQGEVECARAEVVAVRVEGLG